MANEWNASKRFLKIAIDRDGDLSEFICISTLGNMTFANFKDYIEWFASMEGDLNKFLAEKRGQHGSKGSTVFRDPVEENRVWVLFDWDAEGWQKFVSDPEVPAILQEAGHIGRPQAAELVGQYDA